MPQTAAGASGRILRNSYWSGLEQVLEAVVAFGTSSAVARYLGPTKLGAFIYINFFVTIVTRTSGTGLASATRKYMSEFLALDRPGTARAVFNLAYRYQLMGTIVITSLGLTSILLFGDHGYKLMSCILILAIVPGVMSMVPGLANEAFEDSASNTLSAFGYIGTQALVLILTVHYRWDLVGVASSLLIGRSVEVVLRTIPLKAKLRKMPLDKLDDELTARIRRYCLQAMGIQLVTSVVWDRSEMVFLKHFSGLDQIAFYSVSFTFANNLLLFPRTFAGATGMSLMVEASRDPSRANSIVRNACRYLLLVALPLILGAVAISKAAIGFAYGTRYLAAVPVMMVAGVLIIPRAFQEISEVLLRTADRQKALLKWLILTGVVNIALDWLLIPRYGAIGAAWGNGLAQTFGILAVWQQGRRFFHYSFPVMTGVRMSGAAVAMAGLAYWIGRKVPGMPGLLLGVAAAVPTFLLLVKLLRALDPSDRERLAVVGKRLPGSLRRIYESTVTFITPSAV